MVAVKGYDVNTADPRSMPSVITHCTIPGALLSPAVPPDGGTGCHAEPSAAISTNGAVHI